MTIMARQGSERSARSTTPIGESGNAQRKAADLPLGNLNFDVLDVIVSHLGPWLPSGRAQSWSAT